MTTPTPEHPALTAVRKSGTSVIIEDVGFPPGHGGRAVEEDEGRLAYLYDVIAELDPPRAAFALGLLGMTVPSE